MLNLVRLLLGFILTPCLLVIGSGKVFSQYCDSLATKVFTHPRAKMLSIYENDTLDPGQIVPGYHFEFQNDSLRFEYNVREFRHNSRWVMLQSWCAERMYNWSSNTDTDTNELSYQALSALSRTRTVPLLPGDTLSFLKESFWFYHDKDTVEYSRLHAPKWFGVSVEIVDSANGQRLALLDSVRYASIGISIPCLELSTLMLDKLVYIHPENATSKNVFIRVVLNEGSTGVGKWYRTDKIDYAFSGHELVNDNQRGRLFTQQVQLYNGCNFEKRFLTTDKSTLPYSSNKEAESQNLAIGKVVVYSLQGDRLFHTEGAIAETSLRESLANYPAGVYVAVVYVGTSTVKTYALVNHN